jgi:hypothetical protein
LAKLHQWVTDNEESLAPVALSVVA